MARFFSTKGYASPGVCLVDVKTVGKEQFDAAVTALKKERRRRRHTGGKAFEFRVTLQEG